MHELFHVLKFMIGIVALRSEEAAVSIVQSVASIANETGGTSDKFVSNLSLAHELINECKTFSGELYTTLVRTFGESLELVDVQACASSFPQNSKLISFFFQALTFNSTVPNPKVLSFSIEDTTVLAQALRANTSFSSLTLY